jgi:hypothetical protein
MICCFIDITFRCLEDKDYFRVSIERKKMLPHGQTIYFYSQSTFWKYGRLMISSAKKADFSDIEIIDHSLPENVKQQLMKCTASKYLPPYDHPRVQKYRKKVLNGVLQR